MATATAAAVPRSMAVVASELLDFDVIEVVAVVAKKEMGKVAAIVPLVDEPKVGVKRVFLLVHLEEVFEIHADADVGGVRRRVPRVEWQLGKVRTEAGGGERQERNEQPSGHDFGMTRLLRLSFRRVSFNLKRRTA